MSYCPEMTLGHFLVANVKYTKDRIIITYDGVEIVKRAKNYIFPTERVTSL